MHYKLLWWKRQPKDKPKEGYVGVQRFLDNIKTQNSVIIVGVDVILIWKVEMLWITQLVKEFLTLSLAYWIIYIVPYCCRCSCSCKQFCAQSWSSFVNCMDPASWHRNSNANDIGARMRWRAADLKLKCSGRQMTLVQLHQKTLFTNICYKLCL